uniref:MFS transporter n=1 Tax=Alicyclobacillus shizuokensis TaxID=392014 RepID=UPI00082A5AC4
GQWYDFNIYGLAAALVFNKLFFPAYNPIVGTALSFATFAVGFIARPIGGIIFGHFGDKLGRKSMLVLTLNIIGLCTVLIGCLPTYQSIGIWAPIMLMFLRLLQGFGIGGEYGGAALMTIEHAPRDKRGFWAAFPQTAGPAAMLLGTTMFSLFSLLPQNQFLTWGWRMPFLVSIVMLIIGWVIRLRIEETPIFHQMKESKTESKVPIIELFRNFSRVIFLISGARLAEAVSSNIFNVFVITYASMRFGTTQSDVLPALLIASLIGIFIQPIYGLLSDHIGRRPVYMAGSLFIAIFAFPFFGLLNTGSMAMAWLAIILGLVFGTFVMGSVQTVLFTEQLGTEVRYSGLSVAYQGTSILGGLTPLICTSLLAAQDGRPWLVALFLVIVALLSLVSTYWTAETYKKDVSESTHRVAETFQEDIGSHSKIE